MEKSYTKELAEYAINLKYEDLPREVVSQVKELTLHVLGVSLAGCSTKQGKDAIALAKAIGGEIKESTIIGDGSKVSCVQAAFANGTLADVLDWEDCSPTGHPSAGTIPAAVALSEKLHLSGKDYLAAVVAGHEVYQRIAMAVQPTLERWMKSGWGLTSWQIFASAIPTAKLLKLDSVKMAETIGIAGAMTPIPSRKVTASRTDLYHYQHGLTCRDGITAAYLANSGVDLLYDMLDGDTGYWTSISDQCQWEWFTKDLGKKYLIMDTLLKHWPANMWIQQFLDAGQKIMQANTFNAEEIVEIVVSPSLKEKSSRMIYRPEGYLSMTDAQFSIPYCISVFLLDPKPGPNWFSAERMKEPSVLKLASKVRSIGEELSPWHLFSKFQADDYPIASVSISLKDGRNLSKSVTFPKGHSKNKFTLDEHKDFFRISAGYLLDCSKIDMLIETILDLENIDDMSIIGKLIY